ncbi:hypothetical protein ZIOFF_030279 [Zingiber officinale]|uniref:Uncharacterized protein n=1 Tax=Zingiber officinale TaxID=94328 RepID=A0A8J5GV75_ZINOF|nr:hypothetical protein ZIOFF_030279 [Zingiber officinale]
MRVPPWREQVTVRALVVSLGLSVMLSVIVMKLDLTTGVIPSLNVASGLLGFFFIKVWTKALEHAGVLRVPFTRQENTVIQTCVVSAYGIAFSGRNSYFLILMIIDYKLIYPSGTATAYLINGFHTPQGENLAKKQVKTLGKLFLFSFLWGLFQWFYKSGDGCGFEAFPTFGLKAYENKFNFDFSASYVGVGMICPHIVNASLLIGAILSWGIMWPLINNQKGNWFSADLSSDSLHGLEGYRVNPSVSIILGDGLYNFFKVMTKTVPAFVSDSQKVRLSTLPVLHEVHMAKQPIVSYDDDRRTEVFLKDQIPKWVAIGGYGEAIGSNDAGLDDGVLLAGEGQGTRRTPARSNALVHTLTKKNPRRPEATLREGMIPVVRFSFITITLSITDSPKLTTRARTVTCSRRASTLTPSKTRSTDGAGARSSSSCFTSMSVFSISFQRLCQLAIFVFGAWTGAHHGGVLAGLASCGVMMSIVATASDLTQDFKTGYLTLSSPRSMFVSQVIGTSMGCVVAPCVFWLFYKAFDDIGVPYPAPYAIIYRNMAILGVDGFSSLPKHCLTLCYIFFALAILINLARDLSPKKVGQFIPIPMAMAIAFYIGTAFAIDMFIGTVILFV